MKKKSSARTRGNKTALVATMLAVPMISTPSAVYSQRGEIETKVQKTETKRAGGTFIKFSNLQHKVGSSSVSIIGVGDGHTIYQRPNGTKFYVDPQTGDMRTVSDKHWIKMTTETTTAAHDMFLKLDGIKGESSIKLVGVDADGSVIHERPDGTQFKVHTKTGHVTLMK